MEEEYCHCNFLGPNRWLALELNYFSVISDKDPGMTALSSPVNGFFVLEQIPITLGARANASVRKGEMQLAWWPNGEHDSLPTYQTMSKSLD